VQVERFSRAIRQIVASLGPHPRERSVRTSDVGGNEARPASRSGMKQSAANERRSGDAAAGARQGWLG